MLQEVRVHDLCGQGRLKRHFVKGSNVCSAARKLGPYNENDPDDPVNFEGATVESADGYKPDPCQDRAAQGRDRGRGARGARGAGGGEGADVEL